MHDARHAAQTEAIEEKRKTNNQQSYTDGGSPLTESPSLHGVHPSCSESLSSSQSSPLPLFLRSPSLPLFLLWPSAHILSSKTNSSSANPGAPLATTPLLAFCHTGSRIQQPRRATGNQPNTGLADDIPFSLLFVRCLLFSLLLVCLFRGRSARKNFWRIARNFNVNQN